MHPIDPDLPDELRQAEEDARRSQDKRLHDLGVAIGKKRDAAVKARRESGIEAIWKACEDAYLCIDSANPKEGDGSAEFIKPSSMDGPLVLKDRLLNDGAEVKSTVYIPMTRRYVDMAAAKVCEIVLPIGDSAFAISATPVPDLVKQMDDQTPVMGPDGQPVMVMPTPPAAASAPPVPGAPPAAAQAPKQLTQADLAKAKMAQATASAEKAQIRIADWQAESGRPREMRKVIADAARLGVGVLKAPFPVMRRMQAVLKEARGYSIVMEEKTAPASQWVDAWRFYPAAGCGEDITSGDHCLECDFLSESALLDLARQETSDGQPIYLPEQIKKVVQEGPEKCHRKAQEKGIARDDLANMYKVWYFTGTVTRQDMEDAQAVGIDSIDAKLKRVHAVVTMVNDTVIRATLNPLESGRFVYHAFPWSRRSGSWAGVGVAEQICTPQRMVNAGTRELLNNGGKSAGSQWIVDHQAIEPADGNWTLTPDKFWWLTGEGISDDVRKMMTAIQTPNVGPQMLAIIEHGYKLAEEASNIPLVSQGQNGPQDPQTFGQAELQNSNANTLLRAIGYAIDDHITEPETQLYYEYLLLDPDVPDDEKGDFQINARGSSAMVEKAIQEKTWVQLLSVAVNPAYGMSPVKIAEQVLISKRLDPTKVQYSDEEKAQMASAQPPEAPAVTAANINAKARVDAANISARVTVQKTRADTDRDRVYVEAETERSRNEHMARMEELAQRERLAMLDYANKRDLTLEEVRARLADTSMRLQVQKDLSLAGHIMDNHKHNNPSPQVITPASEPAGRAPAGEAFTA